MFIDEDDVSNENYTQWCERKSRDPRRGRWIILGWAVLVVVGIGKCTLG